MDWTPNVRELVCRKMSLLAVPKGSTDGLQKAVDFLRQPKEIVAKFREAQAWTETVLKVIREAPGVNKYKTMSDDEIAGELLRRAKEKDRKAREWLSQKH